MKLVKLHICDTTACAPRHCNAITAGAVRVAGVQINFTGPASGEHDKARVEGNDALGFAIQYVYAGAYRRGLVTFYYQIDGDMVFKSLDR